MFFWGWVTCCSYVGLHGDLGREGQSDHLVVHRLHKEYSVPTIPLFSSAWHKEHGIRMDMSMG